MTLLKEIALGNAARPFNYSLSITMPKAVGVNFSTDQYINTLVNNTSMPGTRLNTREFFTDGRSIKLPGTIHQDQTWSCTFYLDDEYYTRTKMENWIQLYDTYFTRSDPSTSTGLVDAISNKVSGLVGDLLGSIGSAPSLASIGSSFSSGSIVDGLAGTTKFLANGAISYFGLSGVGATPTSATAVITQKAYTGVDISSCTLYNVFPIEISPIAFKDDQVSAISEFTVTFAYSHHEYTKNTGILTSLVNML